MTEIYYKDETGIMKLIGNVPVPTTIPIPQPQPPIPPTPVTGLDAFGIKMIYRTKDGVRIFNI
jgi:hypothetical protein